MDAASELAANGRTQRKITPVLSTRRPGVGEVADDVRSQTAVAAIDAFRSPDQGAALDQQLALSETQQLTMGTTKEADPFAAGERRGAYAYGTLYFEETRLRSRYMLCKGEPGACSPEEVMTNLCDEFKLPNPQMVFFGLGANGRWKTGFATLDVFASKLVAQAHTSGPFRSEELLGAWADERARTALNDWGVLSDLDTTIIDNALMAHLLDTDEDPHAPRVDESVAEALRHKRDEITQFGFALRRYAVGAKDVLHELERFSLKKGETTVPLTNCLAQLAKKIYATTLRRQPCLTKEGLRVYEEYLHEAKHHGKQAPTTSRQLKERYLKSELEAVKGERDKRKKRDAVQLVETMAAHGLRRYTSALEGDPVRMAHGLAHEFFAESATVKAGDAKGNDAPRAAHHAPAVPNDAPPREIECLVVEAERLVREAKGPNGTPTKEASALLKSLEAMHRAWNTLEDAFKAVAGVIMDDQENDAARARTMVQELVARFYYRRQRERAKALYRIRQKKYEHVSSAYMSSVVQASYESRGWLVSELSSRCGFNQSPVMFEGGVRRFAQSYSMSDLTYLGLYTTSYARNNKVNLESLPGLKDLKDTEAPALPDDMTVRFDDDGDSPFTLYTPKGNFDLARHARPTAAEATKPVVYPYYHATNPAKTVSDEDRQRRRVWKSVQKLEEAWPPVDAAMTLRAEENCLRACDSRTKVKTLNRYLRADLSPYCTHLLFFEHESDRQNFRAYLQRLLPHATTVMCGKNRNTMDTCVRRARGGGQIIILKNSGFWCNQMALSVEDAQSRGQLWHKHRSCLRLPANVRASFLEFDVLRASASHVADIITHRLSTASRSEQDIIGFQQAEKGRLLYTWQLVLTYRRSAINLWWLECIIGLLVIVVALGTTCCAVFVKGKTRGPIASGVMSVATGFLIAMQRYFEWGEKAAACELARERITSEIYCYRSRMGDYSQGGSANQLQESLDAFKKWRDRRRDMHKYTRDIFAKWETGALGQTAFAESSRFQKAMAEEDDEEVEHEDDSHATQPADSRNVRATRFQAEVREIERNLIDTVLKSEPLWDGMKFDRYRERHLYPIERWAEAKRMLAAPVTKTRDTSKRLWGGDASEKVAPSWSESDSEESDTEYVAVDQRFHVRNGAPDKADEAEDDGISLITGNAFEKFRVSMEYQRLQMLAHRYGRAQQGLEVLRLSFIAGAAMASLAARPEFVIVTIALGTAVAAFSTMIGGPQRVAMLVSTCSELHCTRIWWYSLSTVEKRQLPHRERLVSETEAALDRLASMWAVQSIKRAKARIERYSGDEMDPGKADNSTLRRRSRPTAAGVPVAAGHE